MSGQYVSRYRCHRCREWNTMTTDRWAQLKPLTIKDFENLSKQYAIPALANLPTQDIRGAGLSKNEASDLFAAGFESSDDVWMWTRSYDRDGKAQDGGDVVRQEQEMLAAGAQAHEIRGETA